MTEPQELKDLAEQMAHALKDHFLARDLDASGEALDRMEALHNQIEKKFGLEAVKLADQYANARGHALAEEGLEVVP